MPILKSPLPFLINLSNQSLATPFPNQNLVYTDEYNQLKALLTIINQANPELLTAALNTAQDWLNNAAATQAKTLIRPGLLLKHKQYSTAFLIITNLYIATDNIPYAHAQTSNKNKRTPPQQNHTLGYLLTPNIFYKIDTPRNYFYDYKRCFSTDTNRELFA